jgi:hypothetical protein
MNNDIKQYIKEYYDYAQKSLGFNTPARCVTRQDAQNSHDIFGKTAYYEPSTKTVVLYVTNRHPKDILRSFSHELVHHLQNERGDLENITAQEGYAQKDKHLRKMEMEAYLKGNMLFRDWEDKKKNG